MIKLILFIICLTKVVCGEPEGKEFLSKNQKELESIEFTLNYIHEITLGKGLTCSNKILLENIGKNIAEMEGRIPGELKERLNKMTRLSLGMTLDMRWIIPFIVLLLFISFSPMLAPHFWEKNRNKALISFLLALPVAIFFYDKDPGELLHSCQEYFSFMALIGSLFIISGGIYLHGKLPGTPGSNTIFLGLGAILANVIGTTGTAMVLFRPFLRANQGREKNIYQIVFFIFIVCNIGGLLTPLGDPPLFLGFIRGVPFQWTFRMFPHWFFVNGVLLAVFYMLDSRFFLKKPMKEQKFPLNFKIHGKWNILFLFGVVLSALLSGYYQMPFGIREAGMIFMAFLSLSFSPISSNERKGNGFTFHPVIEVGVLFAGIFITMIPCLLMLETWGKNLGIHSPVQFFWASGLLSQFLDNAPTYLTFTSLASSLAGTDANHLRELISNPSGTLNLIAISCGSVFMGANTYIGNAPNFMVKAIAEENGIKMPSFIGFMGWSCAFLYPIYFLISFILI